MILGRCEFCLFTFSYVLFSNGKIEILYFDHDIISLPRCIIPYMGLCVNVVLFTHFFL